MMAPPPVMKLDQPDPPQYYSPFDARAKLMNLQNLALQQQEGQQRLQSGQLTIEGQQHAIAQRKAIDEAAATQSSAAAADQQQGTRPPINDFER